MRLVLYIYIYIYIFNNWTPKQHFPVGEPLEYPFWSKFVHGDGSVTGSVVVIQHPSVRNLWPDTINPFSESFKDLKSDWLLTVCPWGTNSLWTTSWLSKKQLNMDFIFDLLILAFLGRGELLVCHSELCRLVSGSYSKIHDSSPVMTCLKKKIGIFDAFKKFSACPILRSKCCGRFEDSNSTHYWSF